jgi:hypothetical protein
MNFNIERKIEKIVEKDSLFITEAKVSDLSLIIRLYKQLILQKSASDFVKLDQAGCEHYFLSFIVQESKKLYLIYNNDLIIGFVLVRSHKPLTFNMMEVWNEMIYVRHEHKSDTLKKKIYSLMENFARTLKDKHKLRTKVYLTNFLEDNIDTRIKNTA